MTDARRGAIEQAIRVLGELWDWLVVQGQVGITATGVGAGAGLPRQTEAYARKLVERGKAFTGGIAGKLPGVPDPYPPVNLASLKVAADGGGGDPAPRRKGKGRTARKKLAGDKIATGAESAGMFD